ncbi:MAG: hypothetical protein LCH96_04395 [Actinobacteria bacterium]|nr:hypothetical protein [Actinomycetota bacterium]
MRPLLILALLLSGCAAIPAVPASAPPSSVPPSPEPVVLLVKAVARGGHCVTGSTCESSLTVMSDGTWTRVVDTDKSTGTLPGPRVTALADAVAHTGLATAPPFTGTCPIAWDGQEQVLTWLADGRTVTVASCDRTFDPDDPLVVATARLQEDLA